MGEILHSVFPDSGLERCCNTDFLFSGCCNGRFSCNGQLQQIQQQHLQVWKEKKQNKSCFWFVLFPSIFPGIRVIHKVHLVLQTWTPGDSPFIQLREALILTCASQRHSFQGTWPSAWVLNRDALLIPTINCGTSIYAGFVIFSVLGYMANEKGQKIEDVATDGTACWTFFRRIRIGSCQNPRHSSGRGFCSSDVHFLYLQVQGWCLWCIPKVLPRCQSLLCGPFCSSWWWRC